MSSVWGVGEPEGRRSMATVMGVPTKLTDESLARHLDIEPARRAPRIDRLAHRLAGAAERRTPALGIGRLGRRPRHWLQCRGVEPRAFPPRLTWNH